MLFTDQDRTASDTICVRDRRLNHLRQVHRAKVGDVVRVGELGAQMGEAEIRSINAECAVLQVTLNRPPPAKLPLELILALPRPKMLRRILRSVAEFGVGSLHLINSFRVEKSYWQTPALEQATIQEYLIQGLEQSMDTIVPKVRCHQRFKPFLEDDFPELVKDSDAILAHPGDYPAMAQGLERNTVLVIGPEGGFIPYEVEKIQLAGCKTVSMGPRILRVENAVSSLLGLARPGPHNTL